MRSAGRSAGIVSLRALFISFAGSIVMFGIVLLTMPGLPNGPVLPWIPILVILAAGAVIGPLAADRPLVGTSSTELAGSYRTRFFMRIAFAEAPALFAFTITFAGGPAPPTR